MSLNVSAVTVSVVADNKNSDGGSSSRDQSLQMHFTLSTCNL